MSALKRQGVVSSWFDRDISGGEEWASRIAAELDKATIIVLLVSADFMASEYCYGVEVSRAMERYEQKEACVIPVLVRSCDWKGTPFERLQALPRDGKAISTWADEDEAFVDVVEGIRRVLRDLQADPAFKAASDTPARVVVDNIPYARNPLFTGREEVLGRLYEALHQEKTAALTQAISGLGGIGKTQTALEYAYRYRDEYTHIFWITADALQTVRLGLAGVSLLLKLPLGQEQEQAVIIEAVKRWMQQHEGWLLILDNVESFADIEGLPPLHARGQTLLTTRSQSVGRRAHVDLATMAVDEGALLLLRRANLLDVADASLAGVLEEDQARAREITRELGGLPLALDQAGAYIEETQCGLQGYLELYRQRYADLLRERGSVDDDYPEKVATTWSLSFEKVQQASSVAGDFLAVCALLDPDAIPKALFDQGAEALSPVLTVLGGDGLAFNEVMRHLLRYSLIRRNPNQTLTIHRLVQVVLQTKMSQQELRVWSERVMKALALSAPPVDYEQDHWPRCLEYLPQVQRGVELIEQQQFTFVEVAQLFHWFGKVQYRQARYQEAAPLLQRALAISEQVVGTEQPLVATILDDLAELYRQQAKYQAAEPLYQ
ncbi:hypothetical protein KDK_13840 [Dictyobacter kobayashii]|uniref:TIR domain-containing protein n=1 Tax=Dictyobacter kobayashii TaxID=2014872 RepID=A0A402AES7_9CHLR|nr:hypothetical protein KDK_13840 [Dictyobacter kobayashii]